MIIIVGGEPDVLASHGMLSERVESMHARKHYVCVSVCVRVVLYVEV